MPTKLKPVDVAVIGLGAAGGVAVLPLARAGLKVAGIEAGTWMDPAQRLPRRRDLQQRSPLGYFRPEGATRVSDASRQSIANRPTCQAPSDDERDRRNVHSLLGAELASQSVGFPDALGSRGRDTVASAIPKGSTLEDWPSTYDDLAPYYDIVEQEVGVSGKAGNIQGRLDPAGNVFEARRRARVSHAAFARQRFHGSHG